MGKDVILVVDNETRTTNLLTHLLDPDRFEIQTMDSTAAALKTAQSGTPAGCS
ncbi:MAG: hypothetical protein GXP54_13110 [Deltaproteobacteria bacterium]|nr:hypothetical protein [Deltaproteobacteria bacterium]